VPIATTVIPQNKYGDKAARSSSEKADHGGTTTQASYEEAAALCQAKVAKIVRECRRINQKYRDPHFDLEFDLKTNRRDCLESLDNTKDDDSDSGSDSSSEGPSGGRRHKRRIIEDREDELKQELQLQSGRAPHDRELLSNFHPKAVKRVGEIFDDPKFYIEGPTANDVRQGRDGDCWLMAALCTLSNKPGLIEKVCVAKDEAVGVYGFVFHRDGEWFSEIIDDKVRWH
jgi:hypothetical protein